MKCIFAILLLAGYSVGTAEELPVCLTPEDELGSRHPFHLVFKDIKWSADSPWFHKAAPVCKAATRPMDLSKFKEEALRRGMVPTKGDWGKLGKAKDGVINYETTKRPHLGVGGNPRLRHFFYGAAPYGHGKRSATMRCWIAPEWMPPCGTGFPGYTIPSAVKRWTS
jgi:hypothetical protein